MDAKAGFTCPNLMEADTDRALIEAGRRLVVLADHTKWGVVGIASIATLDQADVLITDSAIAPDALAAVAEAIPEVILAQVPTDGAARPDPSPRSASSSEVVARAH
jgi:DeoR/GlpR family transcriptional regulator of sugar metabolism